ncbi:inositol 2-dehydrogenase [Chelatococcus daeguensis]|uniref:inositol 2-dehydrogenase n=1 Tax=Chelatococcus daeguensis TaxID=444444 RepID=UPI0007AB3CAB|nr:inositol 2-dehydrogenase [Chelatococcus daeguensis]KZE33639.1 inositol 2-dehydrogenase [Chelatococcus daeguensis]MBM3084776.1 inositol 2-dehydrogenase [Chelatococcus daeguensis]
MLNIGLLGAGRIGITHARAVIALPDVRIAAVFDPVDAAADAAQALTGARRASVEEIMADKDIAAVIVATPTDLHATQVEEAARAGKAIFCEKPIDLSSARAEACLAVVREHNARLMLGFNRRFDPSFARLKAEVEAGAVGKVELVQITSRDPAPPPVDYIKRSGGLFRDMMIHDFDMARFLLGEEVTEVFATGAALVDPAIGAAGDVDTATATLKTASGRIAVITNSRRASYGYDQRLEVHGEKGMIQAGNETATTLTRANASGFTSDPLLDFFMQRYAEAYRLELAAFCRLAAGEDIAVPTGEDGLAALRLADAAVTSLASGQSVRL